MAPRPTHPATPSADGRETPATPASESTVTARTAAITCALIAVLGAVLRAMYLRQPMRYDESVTYLYFAAKPWVEALSSYTYPNNHLFHTALVKVAMTVFGTAPWALRIPAFVAGVACVPATYLAGVRLVGQRASLLGAAIVAASGPLVLYGTNARGYTLVVLATLLLLWLLLRLRERPSGRDWVAVVAVVVLGSWTIPVMLFPAGGLAAWFGFSALAGETSRGRTDLRPLAVAALASALGVGVCYLPVVMAAGVTPVVGNKFVAASPWPVFFNDLLAGVAELPTAWSLGLPWFVGFALWGFAGFGLFVTRRHSARRISIAYTMYVWCAFLVVAMHKVPFARVWLFLLPLVSLCAGVGMLAAMERVRRAPLTDVAAAEFALALAVVLGASVYASRGVLTSRDTGTLRDGPAIAQALTRWLKPGDRIVAPVPANAPLQYYMLQHGLDTASLSMDPAPGGTVYLIVNTAEGYTLETPYTDPVVRRYRQVQVIQEFLASKLTRLVNPVDPR
jgi:4-amino-4-deoxy-L-arabinose transferase-like glycosyltransferase